MIYLSNVFRFIFAYGQKGHQIGRKVGDALEIVIFALISRDKELSKYLIVENGVEGASGAKHKVEFAFYKLNEGKPTKKPKDLFGLIECKKVGAEVTVKQSFKTWQKSNHKPFYTTNGYSFGLATNSGSVDVAIKSVDEKGFNLAINTGAKTNKYSVSEGSILLMAIDVKGELFILDKVEDFYKVKENVKRCLVITTKEVVDEKVTKILVEECLTGPQTPEKAKQASFVSLDVRKKVMGTFDPQKGNGTFVSTLVIGEISHWEEKSLSMIRLCNDYNLFVPDEVIIEIFEKFQKHFGLVFQDMMTKNHYKNNDEVKSVLEEIIKNRKGKVLMDLATNKYVHPELTHKASEPSLTFVEVS
jgi:hypothetical protein